MRIILILLFIPLIIFGQLTVINPGLEGTAGECFVTPAPWANCMPFTNFNTGIVEYTTPDTQPGCYNIVLTPSEGNSYIGFGHIPDYTLLNPLIGADEWQEGFSQELSSPMISGCSYVFTIDLANGLTSDLWSAFETSPVATTIGEMRVFGGFDLCSEQELLWSSGPITNEKWETYAIEFIPADDYSHILFQCVKTEENAACAYLLADNITTIINPDPTSDAGQDIETCETEFTLLGNAPLPGELGLWTLVSGQGTIDSNTNSETTVYNLGIGLNTFAWTLENECGGTNTDEITITVIIGSPTIISPGSLSCLEQIPLIVDVENGEGEWTVTPSEGVYIDDPFSTNTFATVPDYGSYVFYFEGCNGLDSETINMVSSAPVLSGPEKVYCLEIFQLEASVDGDSGYWTGIGPGNVIFNNSTSLTPIVTVDNYGIYEFIYYGCGTNSTIMVEMLSVAPVLSGPEQVYCLESFQLEASIYGDSGYWTAIGPGNVMFNNSTSLTPIVTVDNYGIYEFIYYGCGATSTIMIEVISPNLVIENPGITYCSFQTEINTNSSFSGSWSVGNIQNGNTMNIESDGNSAFITVSDYGDYEIIFSSCSVSDTMNLTFTTIEPFILASDHQNCLLTIDLYAFTPALNSALWEQISGPSIAEILNPYSTYTQAVVSEYGVYEFLFTSCDSTNMIEIGVSCPLEIPNVFTPNGDLNNDLFQIQDLNPNVYTQSVFYVYNKWGKVVYINPYYGLDGEWWDGQTTYHEKPFSTFLPERYYDNSGYVNDGVYFYTLEVYNITNEQKEFYSGYIMIFSKEK